MKKTRLLTLILAFLLMLSSVGVFAEEMSLNPAQDIVQVTAQNPTEEPTEEPVQSTYQLPTEAIALRDNIAGVLAEVEDSWTAFDMALYQKLPGAVCDMTDSAKQAVINSCIDIANSDTTTASDLAKAEIVFRSLGVDSNELYTYNSNDPISNAAALANSDHTSSGHYSAPWILLANLQGNTNLTASQIEALIAVLQQNSANGTFGYEWEGVQYPDPDTAAAVLASLAPMYETNAQAKALCDEILAALDTMISESGSFGSANSDAMVIIGLIAMGKNPAELKNTTTNQTVIDGLMSCANEANNGFTFYGAENYLATEQGFRALVALSLYEGNALNIYDFSDNTVTPGVQQDTESQIHPAPDKDITEITVTMTIKTDTGIWLDDTQVQIAENGTVYDALIAAIDSKDITVTGAEEGYVSAITKNGVTLAEFGKGKNSGWLYKVNGVEVKIGLKDFVLSDGDAVLWYYVADWKDHTSILGGYGSGYSGSGGGSGGGGSVTKPEEPDEEPVVIPEKPVEPEEPEIAPAPEFFDTENHWAKGSIEYVVSSGIMNGVSESEFAPDERLTRAMLVTMLYRLSGSDEASENAFYDVEDDAWYARGANWAAKNGITNGYGDGTFGADDLVTRQQLVVFLMRYAQLKGIDTTAQSEEFKDTDKISDWAQTSVYWAKANGLVSGRDDGTFDPDSGATRGEIAAVFMRFCENILK